MSPDFLQMRIGQLEERFTMALALQNDYENALLLEDDPRTRMKYGLEIEKLTKTIDKIQIDLTNLKHEIDRSSDVVEVDRARLENMENNIEQVKAGQAVLLEKIDDVKSAILIRFDKAEQVVVGSFIDALDKCQMKTVNSILEAIDKRQVDETAWQQMLDDVMDAIREIQKINDDLPPEMVENSKKASAVLEDPKIEINQKLKVAIPAIASYEATLQLKAGINFQNARKAVRKAWDRGKRWIGL